MQDRYVGDVGDFAKYSLLNRISRGRSLGVAWYLTPDESHNADGKHISYLKNEADWRARDPQTFDGLQRLVLAGHRTVDAVVRDGVLCANEVADERLDFESSSFQARADWRRRWFARVFERVNGCEIVFADPDNGLRSDESYRFGTRRHWKSIPICEVRALAAGRIAVIYHHNSRFKGGHEQEIRHWLLQLGNVFAVRMRPFSPRTFFVLNAEDHVLEGVREWCFEMGKGYEVLCK